MTRDQTVECSYGIAGCARATAIFTVVHLARARSRATGRLLFGEPPTAQLLWSHINKYSLVRDRGRQLFRVDSLSQKNALWNEFSSFCRQAQAYWDAAETVRDPSSALLYYYAILNLAKAELLVGGEAANILAGPIHHGLTYSPSSSSSMRADRVGIRQNGVFPRLYELRQKSPLMEKYIPISRAILHIPEVGLEVAEADVGKSRATGLCCAIVNDGISAWPLVCGVGTELKSREFESLKGHFSEVSTRSLPGGWRQIFALSSRLSPVGVTVLQGTKSFSTGAGRPRLPL